jgi:hypothetical protein
VQADNRRAGTDQPTETMRRTQHALKEAWHGSTRLLLCQPSHVQQLRVFRGQGVKRTRARARQGQRVKAWGRAVACTVRQGSGGMLTPARACPRPCTVGH